MNKLTYPTVQSRNVNVLLFLFFWAASFWGCKKQDDANTKPNDTHIAAKFAKKHLTDDEFKAINWDYLREVKNGNTLAGWIVYPQITDSDALSSYFIEIKNGEPQEIISYKIDSKNAVNAGSGVIQYDRKFFVSGKIKSESINLGAEKKVSANDVKGKEVSKLMTQCECCGTLPCVVVYAKRKVKALYIDMGVFDGNDANKIYVPMWEQGGGTGSNGTGENLPNINLSDFIDWTFIGINLFTNEYYPGKEKNFPWRWWEVGTDASWENMDAAFSNQEKMLLELDAAKWLIENPEVNKEIFAFINKKDGDSESLISSRTLLEQLKNNVFDDPNNAQNTYILQANYNIFNCCLPNPINTPAYIADLSRRMALLKQQNPSWTWMECYLEAQWDIIHFGLDILGLVPVGGEIFDVANGVIYTVRGDRTNASLSFVGAVPGVVGWGATGAKWAAKTVHLANGSRRTLTWYRGANNVISFGKENSKQFRELLGIPKGDPRQAHHIIPWELANDGTQEVIQLAAQARFPFHVQDILNGIPLSTAVHYGSHDAYSQKVRKALLNIRDKYGPNLTPEVAFHEIVDLTNRIKVAINANLSTHINQIVF